MTGGTYRQCGLTIRSSVDLDLPIVDAKEWDVDVQPGEDIADSRVEPDGVVIVRYEPDGKTWWYIATSTEQGYRFRFRDCGEFLISSDLRTVEIRRDLLGNHSLLPILAAGTLAALILELRGKTVLHASAVEVGGRTIAFVGLSGQGKTTMAALMCAAGHSLVADDLLVVEHGEAIGCIGGVHELRLRPPAATIFEDDTRFPTRTTADDRTAISLTPAEAGDRPLSALVIPVPSREAEALSIRRLDPSEALRALLSTPRVHGFIDRQILQRDLAVLAAVVGAVPFYAASIPWGPPFNVSMASELTDAVLGSD